MLSESKGSQNRNNEDELYKLYRKAKAAHEKNKLDQELEELLIDAYKSMIVSWSKKRDRVIEKFRETKNIDLYHECANLNNRILDVISEDGYEINKAYYSFSEENSYDADAKKIKDELATFKESTPNFILKTVAEFSRQRDELIEKFRKFKGISFYEECFALNNKIIAIIREVKRYHPDYAKMQVYSGQAQKVSIELCNIVKSTPQLILDPVKEFITKHDKQIGPSDDCKKVNLPSAIESGDCHRVKSIIRQKLFGVDENQEDLKINQLLQGQKVSLDAYFSLLNKENANELVFNLVVFVCLKLEKSERSNNWRAAQLIIDSLKEEGFVLEKDFGVMAVNTSKVVLSNFEKMLYEISKLSISCQSPAIIKKSKKKIINTANKFLPNDEVDKSENPLAGDDKLKESMGGVKQQEYKIEEPAFKIQEIKSTIQEPETLTGESIKIFSKTIGSIVKPLNKMITGGRFSGEYVNKIEAKIFLIANEDSIMFLHKGQYKLIERNVLIRKLAALLKEMKFDITFEFRASEITFKSPKELAADQVMELADRIVKNQMKKNKNYNRFGSKATISAPPSTLFFSASASSMGYQVSDISQDFDEDMQKGFMAYDEEKMESMPGVSRILSYLKKCF